MSQETDLRDIGASYLTNVKGTAYVNSIANRPDATSIFTAAGQEYVDFRKAGGINPGVNENGYFQTLLARFGVTAGLSQAAVSAGVAGYAGVSPQHPAFAGIASQVALPHPDASNQSLGPNLGGADAVTLPGESGASQASGSGLGGLFLLGGGILLVLVLLRKK